MDYAYRHDLFAIICFARTHDVLFDLANSVTSYTGPDSGCVLIWSVHDEKQSIKRVDIPSP